jgi:hypothetical protein
MHGLGLLFEAAPDWSDGLERSETERTAPAHADTRRLLDFWYAHERSPVIGTHLPSRAIGRLLPNLAVFDYRAVRNEFRVRLAGLGLVRRFGRDISHHYLSEVVSAEDHERLHATLMSARDVKLPQIREVKIHGTRRTLLHYEMIGLRVIAADKETPLVLGGFFFFDRNRPVRADNQHRRT